MKKLIHLFMYALVLLSLGWGACTEKDSISPRPGNGSNPNPQDPNPQPQGNLLSKIDWGGGAFTELKYNDNKQVSEIKEVNNANIWTYKLFYDANKRLDYARLNDYARILYNYEGDKVVKIEEINGTTSVHTHHLTYNAQNQLIERLIYYKKTNEEPKLSHRNTFEYNAEGNLVKFQLFMPKADSDELQLSKTITYSEFDNKQNVDRFLHFKPLFFYKFFQNNPKKVTTIDELGSTPNYQETYKYTYNSQGKPIQLEVVYTSNQLPVVRGNAFLSYVE
ncbi:MAG: hypothetical protein MUE85_14045 [Microscillaceae bacterium]|jgi:hypothetical protein|nr:hypothetical protein [Microscillaceae bacterium]